MKNVEENDVTIKLLNHDPLVLDHKPIKIEIKASNIKKVWGQMKEKLVDKK